MSGYDREAIAQALFGCTLGAVSDAGRGMLWPGNRRRYERLADAVIAVLPPYPECDECGLAAVDLPDGLGPEFIFELCDDGRMLCQGCQAKPLISSLAEWAKRDVS